MTADSSFPDTKDASSSSRQRRVSESPVIRRLRVKSSEGTPPPPAIDFSNLRLDNGTIVSTKERVITGGFVIGLTQCPPHCPCSLWRWLFNRSACTCCMWTDRRAILEFRASRLSRPWVLEETSLLWRTTIRGTSHLHYQQGNWHFQTRTQFVTCGGTHHRYTYTCTCTYTKDITITPINSVRRYPWPILWSYEAVWDWRWSIMYKVPILGWLRGSRLLFYRGKKKREGREDAAANYGKTGCDTPIYSACFIFGHWKCGTPHRYSYYVVTMNADILRTTLRSKLNVSLI